MRINVVSFPSDPRPSHNLLRDQEGPIVSPLRRSLY